MRVLSFLAHEHEILQAGSSPAAPAISHFVTTCDKWGHIVTFNNVDNGFSNFIPPSIVTADDSF